MEKKGALFEIVCKSPGYLMSLIRKFDGGCQLVHFKFMIINHSLLLLWWEKNEIGFFRISLFGLIISKAGDPLNRRVLVQDLDCWFVW